MSAENLAQGPENGTDYITHHLSNLTIGQGFWTLHVDTLFFSLVLGATGAFLWFGHVLAGTLWAIFHILIVVLQAFIFMMLTLVYVGQAHESH